LKKKRGKTVGKITEIFGLGRYYQVYVKEIAKLFSDLKFLV